MKNEPIDRYALVHRHNPTIRQVEPFSPLSVGNGEFAFTADFTGLQSFPEQYEVPLGTQSQWGWHSTGGKALYNREELGTQPYETNGRMVGYHVYPVAGEEQPYHWLRQNPHRLQLGQIGLRMLTSKGVPVAIEDIKDIAQVLDLWRGVITSRFTVNGVPVSVQTCCHPTTDQLSVRIDSPLLSQQRLEVAIAFPAAQPTSREWSESTRLNWDEDDSGHHTELSRISDHEAVLTRSMDQDGYKVYAAWSAGELVQDEQHKFRIQPGAGDNYLECTFAFRPSTQEAMAVEAFPTVVSASEHYWKSFWSEGGAVDFSGSSEPRAIELERRVVLSQFLTAIHCSGSLPPQETGLLYNSWFGKFHLEMHWWHAVHFALWGRTPLLRKSLGFYRDILPVARKLAVSQGYEGARWPKMVGPEGQDSPSPIGTLLIWQQPHPIVYAELCYLADPTAETLEQFKEVVLETARFMASFAVWDAAGSRYVLGPPVIPAQEEHKPELTCNPTFELEYWRHGLEIAERWRERLSLEAEPKWRHICEHLAELPVAEGLYLAHENCPETFDQVNTDHPSMLGAMGILPGRKADSDTMRNTLQKVMKVWNWQSAWGWDFPMTAMTAARVGERQTAVDVLLMDAAKNTYFTNGHNYQRPGLTAYLPGNGGLLAAVALMACGWQGGTDHDAPGFPTDGSWIVRSEGLNPWL
jgi:hypothetical protein